MKNIIKEVIIYLLLTLAIILILGVALYNYVPFNKVVPEEVSYSTPEALSSELEEYTEDMTSSDFPTYEITDSDISNYKTIQEYVPGRKNPFKSLKKNEVENNTIDGETADSTGNTENNSSNSSSKSTSQTDTQSKDGNSSDTSSSSGYLPNKGTK